jgi:hypothetical protein
MEDVRELTVAPEHLTLLRHARVSWTESEFGAPMIDAKGPYGNPYVTRDMTPTIRTAQQARYWCD